MSDTRVVRDTVYALMFMMVIYILGAMSLSPIQEISYVIVFAIFAIAVYSNLTYVKKTTKSYAELMQERDNKDEDEVPVFGTVEELFDYIDKHDNETEEDDE